jgi:putative ABC transport system permease protein
MNLIKVVGISLALSCALIILLFIVNELSYDKFHKRSDRIYRLTTTSKNNFAGKHFAKIFDPSFLPKMAAYFPQIENYVRLVPVLGGVIKYDEQFIKTEQAFQCDSTFFEIFDAELLVGKKETILHHPGSMVISESFAAKVFGRKDPIGQILTLPAGQYYGEPYDFVVKGVMKDFPQTSHFHPEFITTPTNKAELDRVAWTYLLLEPKTNPENITSGFEKFYSTHVTSNLNEKQNAYLQKINDIHLYSSKLREIESNSNISVIYTLGIAAILLISIAILNFINLNAGMTVFTEKYLRMSKILGSFGNIALRYFLQESTIILIISVTASILIVQFANHLIIKNFSLRLLNDQWPMILFGIALFCLVFLVTGALLSTNNKIVSLQSAKTQTIQKKKNINTSLIILQNTISICLIVSVIIIYQQTNFALSSSLGFQSDNIVCIENVHSDIQSKFEVFKSELHKYSSIKSISAMLDTPGGEANDMMPFKLEGYATSESDKMDSLIGVMPCDYSLTEIFDLKFLCGNNFSKKNDDNDGSGEYIINESALSRLHYTNPTEILGKEFSISFDPSIKIPKGRIIGVVKDFHLSSLKKKIEPLVLFKRKDLWLLNFIIEFQPGMDKQGLSDLELIWKKMFPGHKMEYNYVSHIYESTYKTELLQTTLLSIFTIIAIFMSAMGLLGLSLLTTQRRMKEMAIRKVNGAETNQLITMLCWYFIKLIIVAFLISIPLSLYAMSQWLEPFAYKVQVKWWVFAVAGLAAFFMAFLSIIFHSLKAAKANPVETLRSE